MAPPMPLEELAASLCTGAVSFRGRSLPARAVSSSESVRLMRMRPRPAPPLKPGRRKADGSPDLEAEPAPDERDPRYIAAYEAWAGWYKSAEIAIALDLSIGGAAYQADQDDGRVLAWADAAAEWIASHWSRGEVNEVHEAISSLSDEATIAGAARKN